MTSRETLAGRLLHWYDRHHRTMPWRVAPDQRVAGVRPEPYHVWLSEVMLQQTTVAAVRDYFVNFTRRWPTVAALAAAPRDDVLAAWAGLGYYARARNLHACAQAVADAGGRFPEIEEGLRALPGIGPYTAAAIAAIAFDEPAAVVDGNVERVMARLFAETDPLPGVKDRLKSHAAGLTPSHRPGDYAQAVMDLGATICTPRQPACGICPWGADCRASAQGIAEHLPARAPKKVKPVRHGTAYLAIDRAGRVLTVRRPESGLLGGMLALPSTDWAEAPPEPAPPFAADWQPLGEVRHTFTHFHLRLAVDWVQAEFGQGAMAPDEAEATMPTVFAKALRLARQPAG
ncbi:MAG: A/G-specific adenine glycosylase [Paracoccaceae bacterium]|nr:A/G-specific adenine glycosylase [Paracoccaceae bacterium]